jgi:hypothetical protein
MGEYAEERLAYLYPHAFESREQHNQRQRAYNRRREIKPVEPIKVEKTEDGFTIEIGERR